MSTNNIEYELNEEEKPNFKDNEKFGKFSIVLIEKEIKINLFQFLSNMNWIKIMKIYCKLFNMKNIY